MNYLKILKLKCHLEENVADFCAAILLHANIIEGGFKSNKFWYITCIFENTYDTRFRIWSTKKYIEVTGYTKKRYLCDEYFMQPEGIITYDSLV